MSLIKFLYKSQYVVDDSIQKDSINPVTGSAVYEAIESIKTDKVLQSGYIANCLATIDRQHHLSFENGSLKLLQGDKVFVPNGIDNETGELLFKEHVLSKDVLGSYNHSDSMISFMFIDIEQEEWVGNSERTLIFDQDSQQFIDQALQRVFVQPEAPRINNDRVIWWDTTTNKMKEYNGQRQDWDDKEYSVPVCRVTKEAGVITGIEQDFLVSGYCGYAMWLNPGCQFIMSQGREVDGTFSIVSMTTDHLIAKFLENSAEGYEDQCFYVTITDEIVGPVEHLSFNSFEGYFLDPQGNKLIASKVATATAEHLTTASTDPLTITSYVSEDCLHIADKNDVDYLIQLIGSSTGDTIDTLLARILALTDELARVKAELEQNIEDTATNLKSTVDDEVVHKDLEETVIGSKTFTEDIIGNITGNAQTLEKETTALKVLYPCGVEEYADGREKTYVNTTVKIGPNYVEANEFRGVSTATRWADLAEKYLTDIEYPIGTLVKWGGEKEMTAATEGCVNAVISEKPAHLMNAGDEGQPIALVGRVRVRVVGTCKKFQAIVPSAIAGVGIATNDSDNVCIRALEDKISEDEGLVLCVVSLRI